MGKKRNIIVGQSGGPTSVINSSLAGVYKTAKERGFHKVYGMLHGIEGLLDEMYVDLSTQIHSDMDIELLKRTPSAFLGSCRYKLPDIHENPAFYEKIFAILDKLDIEVFIYIGGTKEVIRDAMGLSYRRKTITIMECMGRNAGWLTGSTALAKTEDCCGPDLIYLPEIPFDIEKFLKKCKELIQKKPSIVIAVSEGIRVPDGRYVCQLSGGSDYVDAFGHKQLAGTADYLAGFLAGELGCKTRSVELSTLQRSASHVASRVDINEAFMVGGAAVKAADEGDTGKMVVIDRVSDDPYMSAAGIYDVHKIANNEKTVPRSWVNKDGSYVTQEFVSYVEPLIQGDYQPFMVNGLPQHLVLKR